MNNKNSCSWSFTFPKAVDTNCHRATLLLPAGCDRRVLTAAGWAAERAAKDMAYVKVKYK